MCGSITSPNLDFLFLFVVSFEDVATHSSIPAWKIPWTEEPGGLQSMASQRVGHD